MPRTCLVLLIAAGTFTSATAEAGGFSTIPSIRVAPRITVSSTTITPMRPVMPIETADHHLRCHYGYRCGDEYGYGSGEPPAPAVAPQHSRVTVFNTNDQFDTTGNPNPGGGDSGMKPGKKPNAQ